MKKTLAIRLCTAILSCGILAGTVADNDSSLEIDDEWGVYILCGYDVYCLSPEYVGPVWDFKDKDIFKALRDNPV